MNYWVKMALAVSAVGLLFGVWFWDDYRTEKKVELEQVEGKALKFAQADVKKMVLVSENTNLVFERENNATGWKIPNSTSKIKLDQEAINGMLSSLENLNYSAEIAGTEKIVSGTDTDKQPYGLDKPKIVVEITSKDNVVRFLKIGADINIGKKTGDKFEAMSVFAMSSSMKNVLALNAASIPPFKKSFIDFRSKLIADFKVSDVKSFVITNDLSLIKANKTEKDWKISFPRELTADTNNVSTFLSTLSGFKADKITEAEMLKPENMGIFGLDAPAATLDIIGADNKLLQSFKIGKTQDSVYITMADGAVGSLDLGKWKELVPELKFLRDKRIVHDVFMSEVVRIKTKSGKLYVKEGVNWYPNSTQKIEPVSVNAKATPTPAPKVANSDAGSFFSDWEFMAADDIIDEISGKDLSIYGFDKPSQEFWFEFADPKKAAEHFIVGNKVPKDEKMVYVKRESLPAIFVVEASWLARLAKLDGANSK